MTFFSEDWPQEIVALAIAAIAAVFVIRRLTGWPRKKTAAGPAQPDAVRLGGRLARGLKKAERRKST